MVVIIGLVWVGMVVVCLVVNDVKCVYFEFGGKVLVIVFVDVLIEKVVEGIIVGVFFNGG